MGQSKSRGGMLVCKRGAVSSEQGVGIENLQKIIDKIHESDRKSR